MAENLNRETAEQQARRRATEASRQTEQRQGAETAQEEVKSYSPTLLGESRLGDRGNTSVRADVMRTMQSTHGNRAVQRALQNAAEPVGAEDDQIARRIESASGSGGKLDAPVQARLEEGLGAEMSGVRIHTGGEADRLARSMSAVAFTTGNDIFFREGAYDPHSAEGLKLLAHEATHTVQQSQGSVEGTPSAGGVSISDPSDQYEQAAEQAAERVTGGKSGNSSGSTIKQGGGAPSASNMENVQRTMIPWDYQQGPNPSNSSYPQGAGQAGRVPTQSSGGYGTQGAGQAGGGGYGQTTNPTQGTGGAGQAGYPSPTGSFPYPSGGGGGFLSQIDALWQSMNSGFPFPTNDFPGQQGGGFPGQMGGGFPGPFGSGFPGSLGSGFPFPTNDFPDQMGGGFPGTLGGWFPGQMGGGFPFPTDGGWMNSVGDPHITNSQIPGYGGGYPQGGSPGEQPEYPAPEQQSDSPFPWLEPEWPSPSTSDWPTPSIPDWPTPGGQEQEPFPWLNSGTFEQEDPGTIYM